MASASPTLSDAELWPAFLNLTMVVFDFDKTITKKHTSGAIFQTAQMADDVLLENFADIEFFRRVIPLFKQHATIAIATFADQEEDALLSGKDLVRKYLNLAFGERRSQELIPGLLSLRDSAATGAAIHSTNP
eukprot:m.28429 g.28429  ORF g.28429 m.28429 type:complete len:133 (-) comp40163_c0_seq2:496-894(-)